MALVLKATFYFRYMLKMVVKTVQEKQENKRSVGEDVNQTVSKNILAL